MSTLPKEISPHTCLDTIPIITYYAMAGQEVHLRHITNSPVDNYFLSGLKSEVKAMTPHLKKLVNDKFLSLGGQTYGYPS